MTPDIAHPDVALLHRAIEIESLSGQESAIASYLVDAMLKRDFTRAYVDAAGNAVGERGPASAGNTIVLLGHMDTVPGHIPVRIEGDRLYGRGSVDAKGPLCAFIAATAAAELPADTRWVVVGAVEEEAATSKGARYIAQRFLKEDTPAAAIIGEPSAWDRITLGYKGRMLVDLTLSEPMGHTAAEGHEGIAAAAIQWWQRVKELCDAFNAERTSAFDRLFPSIRDICTTSDGLTNQVTARIGLRLPLDIDLAALEAQVAAALPPPFDPNDESCELHFYAHEPAYRADKNTPLVRAFLQAIRQHGGRPGFKVKTGTSDMNVVGPLWNCPIVAYGPGDSLLDHTPDEHISLAEYLRAIEVLKTVLPLL